MNLRTGHETLVADFLARGGIIRKLPPPKAIVADDVVQYLQTHNIDVQAIARPGESELGYVHKGQVVTLKALVAIANRHRRRRHLPPLQLSGRLQ